MSNGYNRTNDTFAEGYGKISDKTKRAMERVSAENHAAGTMVGYYDKALTILAASDDLLNSLGYTYQDFLAFTGGSLRRLLREENAVTVTPQKWKAIHSGETSFVTGRGSLVPVWLCKTDNIDAEGIPVWVLSARVDAELEHLSQVSEAIGVGSWSMDCSAEGNITQVCWSHALRRILGYEDVLDFPNDLKTLISVLHPADRDAVLGRLMTAIWDRNDQLQIGVKCRLMRKKDGWGWFHVAAEISRRPDGTASSVTGVLIDIDEEVCSAEGMSGVERCQGALAEDDKVERLIQKMSALVNRFAVCDLENDQYGYVSMSQGGDYPFNGRYSDLVRLAAKCFKTLPPLDALSVMMSPERLRENLHTGDDVLKFEYCSLNGDDCRMATVIPLDWRNGILTKVLCTSANIEKPSQQPEL